MITAHTLVTRCGGRELRWGQRTFIMGVVNATPDSFSGDGIADDPDAAARQAQRFAADGPAVTALSDAPVRSSRNKKRRSAVYRAIELPTADGRTTDIGCIQSDK